ncbi:MAG: hypothetical protein FWG67_01775 [Defluviitaleaceae bacterium]|nr:hypothetical protein [Defluviitaleaceae bacterium]
MRIYILLTQTTSVLTKVIKFCTKTPYNHASLAFDARLEYTYSFGRVNPNDPLIGGFAHERLDAGVFKDATCQLLSLDVTPEQYAKMRERVAYIEANQLKYKYNFIGLFGIPFNFNLNRKYAYFCSQFVSQVLQEVGLFPEDFPSHLVKPTDLVEHVNLKVEYQGSLAAYLELAGAPAFPEREADVLLRRKLLFMPFRVLFVPIKVAKVGTTTLKTSRRYLNQSRKYITEKIFQDEQSG